MGRNCLILMLFAFLFAYAGCEKGVSETKPQTVSANASSSPTASVPPTPLNSPTVGANNSKIKLFDGKGTVTKINLKLVSVELDHEEIKGLMPAMLMEFYVKEKSELEPLKVGDKVDFVLEDNAGAERIISIKKIP